MERGWRDITPNCPRCGSSNTKFCYYNNYSLTQPRYFCKGCRRYWTKGGSLRNVPVGGGCRKSRRSRSSSLRQLSAVSSNLNNNHHGVTPIYGTNNNNGHNSYGIISNNGGDLSNVVESSTPSINPEVPTIDLAAVYANFLTQKSSTTTSKVHDQVLPSEFNNPPHVDFSSIPDATTIVPNTSAITTQIVLQEQVNIVMENNSNNPPFSQTLPMPPPLSNDVHDHNQYFVAADFSTSLVNHHHHHHGDTSIMQDELEELPPFLPGESSSHHHQEMQWISSNNNNTNEDEDQEEVHQQGNLEQDAQFSNLFIGSWSPLDLPGFETSSSPPKP